MVGGLWLWHFPTVGLPLERHNQDPQPHGEALGCSVSWLLHPSPSQCLARWMPCVLSQSAVILVGNKSVYFSAELPAGCPWSFC